MEQPGIERNITLYVAAWNEEGLNNIKFALTAFWTDETTYIDFQTPLTTGIDALARLIQQSHALLPGRRFSQLTRPDMHNYTDRYTWRLHRTDGTTADGMDFFEFNSTGFITRIVGFLKPLEVFTGQ